MVQSENILLRFLRRGHADDGCSYRAVPPSANTENDFLIMMAAILDFDVFGDTQRNFN